MQRVRKVEYYEVGDKVGIAEFCQHKRPEGCFHLTCTITRVFSNSELLIENSSGYVRVANSALLKRG